ncbi:MAG TPA: hypothetical protein VKN99_03140 [Polyangia bacterium]|nr:hypothetical protein [Polyangia bacterium]
MIDFIRPYPFLVADGEGRRYACRAYGQPRPDDLWEGWFVFFPVDNGRRALATDRETTQPRRQHLAYWADGISKTFLEGALARALRLRPEALLERRAYWAGEEAAQARIEAELYERAAVEARAQAERAERLQRAMEARLARLEDAPVSDPTKRRAD